MKKLRNSHETGQRRRVPRALVGAFVVGITSILPVDAAPTNASSVPQARALEASQGSSGVTITSIESDGCEVTASLRRDDDQATFGGAYELDLYAQSIELGNPDRSEPVVTIDTQTTRPGSSFRNQMSGFVSARGDQYFLIGAEARPLSGGKLDKIVDFIFFVGGCIAPSEIVGSAEVTERADRTMNVTPIG